MATSVVTPMGGFRFEAPDPDPVPVPGAPVAPQQKVDPGPAKDERYDALDREVQELRQSNRDLMGLVGRVAPQPVAPARTAKSEEEDSGIDFGLDDDNEDPLAEEDPSAVVDDISKLGAAALAKRGFVRRSEVVKIAREESRRAATTAATQVVNRARGQATTESSIMREFPDLADQNSELFKATIPHVQAAARLNPKSAQDPAILYLAARTAAAELKGKGGREDEPPARRSTRDRDDDREDERPARSERELRIASQQGDRGRTRSRIESDQDEEFVMSDDAKSVARAMGLTDDEYKKEATRVRAVSGRKGR